MTAGDVRMCFTAVSIQIAPASSRFARRLTWSRGAGVFGFSVSFRAISDTEVPASTCRAIRLTVLAASSSCSRT